MVTVVPPPARPDTSPARPIHPGPPATGFRRPSVRRIAAGARTTPGMMLVAGAVLVVMVFTAGLVALFAVQSRQDAARDVAERSELLGVQTQEIYRALADADATAAAGLLEGGVESNAVRERYFTAIDDAARTLSEATAAGVDGEVAEKLSVIARRLPEYSRWVEHARAETRQGNTVGAAYLRAASEREMRGRILPAARTLHEIATERLKADHERATATPWAAYLLVFAALVALVAAQWLFARRTRRRLNVGLLIATLATTASAGWLWFGLNGSRSDIDRSREDGWGPVKILAEARFSTLRAHGDEGLILVMRGSDGGAYEKDFTAERNRLLGNADGPGLLDQALRASSGDGRTESLVRQAKEAATDWDRAHTRVMGLYGDGRFEDAVQEVIGAEGAARTAFTRLDEALDAALAEDQADFRRALGQGRDALSGLGVGAAVLGLFAAAAAAEGVRRRVKEYSR